MSRPIQDMNEIEKKVEMQLRLLTHQIIKRNNLETLTYNPDEVRQNLLDIISGEYVKGYQLGLKKAKNGTAK